eukprot:gnl/MRDRNA2_/MRDRNA2_76540_c0_seq2.p1 gnl/MRDRNA2_/MRDRNA2_76540_c0~~gnl/MRDRNA2_/MRDRNA2_76540_c0_seq2.p1  ORF type:complete len:2413 (+),score=413.30 gnl/MRDRNA2_/MRDRNA2_76540_c0_seq2:124-7362(+)
MTVKVCAECQTRSNDGCQDPEDGEWYCVNCWHQFRPDVWGAAETIQTQWRAYKRRKLAKQAEQKHFKLNQKVKCGAHVGRVRFEGTTEFAKGVWVGIELDEPEGKNNGTVKGKRYFDCKPNYGLFMKVADVVPYEEPNKQESDTDEIKVGDRVKCEGHAGYVKYYGTTEFAKGVWVGVALDEPHGKNDGTVKGKRYFTCEPNYGIFTRADKVEKIKGEEHNDDPGIKIKKKSESNEEKHFSIGQQVRCSGHGIGHVRYEGAVKFAEGVWIGVELVEEAGKNDGSVKGERYFECKPGHGIFVKPQQAEAVDKPAGGTFSVGQRVKCGTHIGHVRFHGDVDFAQGTWVGVELMEKAGKNDGTVRGKRYFDCKPGYGLFMEPHKIEAANFAMGERVKHGDYTGHVRFQGTTDFEEGFWVGIELDEKRGEHDGSVQGRSYFTCAKGHGVFARPDTLKAAESGDKDKLAVGQRVQVGHHKGTVRFSGTTAFSEGTWIGIELDEKAGKNDGTVKGKRYFHCKPGHGVFMHPEKVLPLDGDDLDKDLDEPKEKEKEKEKEKAPEAMEKLPQKIDITAKDPVTRRKWGSMWLELKPDDYSWDNMTFGCDVTSGLEQPLDELWNESSEEDRKTINHGIGDLDLRKDVTVLVVNARINTTSLAKSSASPEQYNLDIASAYAVLQRTLQGPWGHGEEIVRYNARTAVVLFTSCEDAVKVCLECIRRGEALRQAAPSGVLEGVVCGVAKGTVLHKRGGHHEIFGEPVDRANALTSDTVAKAGEIIFDEKAVSDDVSSWPNLQVRTERRLPGWGNEVTHIALISEAPSTQEKIQNIRSFMESLHRARRRDPLVGRFLNGVRGETEEDIKGLRNKYETALTLMMVHFLPCVSVARGPMEALLLLVQGREILVEEIAKHGGELLRLEEDRTSACFQSPAAALRCALDTEERISRDQKNIRLRIGVECGHVYRLGQDLLGTPMDVCTSLSEGLVEGCGQVLAGPALHKEVSVLGVPSGCKYEPFRIRAGRFESWFTSYCVRRQGEDDADSEPPSPPSSVSDVPLFEENMLKGVLDDLGKMKVAGYSLCDTKGTHEALKQQLLKGGIIDPVAAERATDRKWHTHMEPENTDEQQDDQDAFEADYKNAVQLNEVAATVRTQLSAKPPLPLASSVASWFVPLVPVTVPSSASQEAALSDLQCAECGKHKPQGVFDAQDGEWYCSACYQQFEQEAKQIRDGLLKEKLQKTAKVRQRFQEVAKQQVILRRKAVFRLQRAWKSYLQRKSKFLMLANLEIQRQTKAALTLQCIFRGKSLRQQMMSSKDGKKAEFARQKSDRMKKQRSFQGDARQKARNKKEKAAILVQSWWRGHQARKSTKAVRSRVRRHRARSAVIIQSECRAFLCRMEYLQLTQKSSKMEKAATDIQCHIRGHLQRKHVQEQWDEQANLRAHEAVLERHAKGKGRSSQATHGVSRGGVGRGGGGGRGGSGGGKGASQQLRPMTAPPANLGAYRVESPPRDNSKEPPEFIPVSFTIEGLHAVQLHKNEPLRLCVVSAINMELAKEAKIPHDKVATTINHQMQVNAEIFPTEPKKAYTSLLKNSAVISKNLVKALKVVNGIGKAYAGGLLVVKDMIICAPEPVESPLQKPMKSPRPVSPMARTPESVVAPVAQKGRGRGKGPSTTGRGLASPHAVMHMGSPLKVGVSFGKTGAALDAGDDDVEPVGSTTMGSSAFGSPMSSHPGRSPYGQNYSPATYEPRGRRQQSPHRKPEPMLSATLQQYRQLDNSDYTPYLYRKKLTKEEEAEKKRIELVERGFESAEVMQQVLTSMADEMNSRCHYGTDKKDEQKELDEKPYFEQAAMLVTELQRSREASQEPRQKNHKDQIKELFEELGRHSPERDASRKRSPERKAPQFHADNTIGWSPDMRNSSVRTSNLRFAANLPAPTRPRSHDPFTKTLQDKRDEDKPPPSPRMEATYLASTSKDGFARGKSAPPGNSQRLGAPQGPGQLRVSTMQGGSRMGSRNASPIPSPRGDQNGGTLGAPGAQFELLSRLKMQMTRTQDLAGQTYEPMSRSGTNASMGYYRQESNMFSPGRMQSGGTKDFLSPDRRHEGVQLGRRGSAFRQRGYLENDRIRQPYLMYEGSEKDYHDERNDPTGFGFIDACKKYVAFVIRRGAMQSQAVEVVHKGKGKGTAVPQRPQVLQVLYGPPGGADVQGTSAFVPFWTTLGSPALGVKNGRWYFEVKMLGAVDPQVGWADRTFFEAVHNKCLGVGDNAHSWAVDGRRQQLWHKGRCGKYDSWWSDPVRVGCAIDIDRRLMFFTTSGNWDSPPCFDGFKFRDYLFPAVSGEFASLEFCVVPADIKFSPPDASYKVLIPYNRITAWPQTPLHQPRAPRTTPPAPWKCPTAPGKQKGKTPVKVNEAHSTPGIPWRQTVNKR